MKRLLKLCAVAGFPASLAAQSPPPRAHHTMFFDPMSERVMLTGGSTPRDGGSRFEFFNDLWAFDGTRWEALPASGERLSGLQVAADARGRLYSFGGFNGGSIGAVRILDGGQWRVVGEHPTLKTAEPGFVFDAKRGRFVAFGGTSGPRQVIADAYDYDGSGWTRHRGVTPPPRAAHAMVYDARRGVTVVFGGMGEAGRLGDTWEFDGTAWKQIAAPGPSGRVSPGAAYDSKRGVVMMFGGTTAEGFANDLWSWDGLTWKKLADTGPEPRAMGYLAYDAKRDRTVLFGGRKGYPDGDLGDTWEWDGVEWKRFTAG
jgi:hypothetical protein